MCASVTQLADCKHGDRFVFRWQAHNSVFVSIPKKRAIVGMSVLQKRIPHTLAVFAVSLILT